MPGITDWQSNPLATVQHMYEEDSNLKTLSNRVTKYFEQRLSGQDALLWISSLNDTPLHNLKNNVLVRFRCMVQDMFDPEFYIGAYEVLDKNTGQKAVKCGMYRDLAECASDQHIDTEASSTIPLDRQTLYCVPIPAENQWVKKAYADQSKCKQATTCHNSQLKRQLDEEDMLITSSAGDLDLSGPEKAQLQTMRFEINQIKIGEKRLKQEEESTSGVNHVQDLNFPLANECGPACLVKIYTNFEAFKVNDVVEFIGVLSVDPALAESSLEDDMSWTEEDKMMLEKRAPPPSLVPRLHSIIAHKLNVANPILPTNVDAMSAVLVTVQSQAELVRTSLCTVFKSLLGEDSVAAEYLLMHLLSNVYARREMLALGKFSLNISGCQASSCLPEKLNSFLEKIVTKSHFLPISLSNMNMLRFSPKKDYTAQRLKSGILQLSDQTHLIVDETALGPGQLDKNGIENLTALGNAITWQKLEYDFNFHKADFPTNLIFLILSEAKSLLPSDCHVKLETTHTDGDVTRAFDSAIEALDESTLDNIRRYLGIIRIMEYTLTETIQKEIEEEFVELRKVDPHNMTVDDFHCLLLVARLLCLSYGQTTLTKEIWQRAQVLEASRKCRIGGTEQTLR